MKKGRFLWSAHRITERQKAGKARSIKGKQLKNSRSTVSRQLVAHLSSASADRDFKMPKSPGNSRFSGAFLYPFRLTQKGGTRHAEMPVQIPMG